MFSKSIIKEMAEFAEKEESGVVDVMGDPIKEEQKADLELFIDQCKEFVGKDKSNNPDNLRDALGQMLNEMRENSEGLSREEEVIIHILKLFKFR